MRGDRPMLLLLGIRLGLEGVNPVYHETIKMLYSFPRPPAFLYSRSAYFTPGQKRLHSWGSRERAAAAVSGEQREYVPPLRPHTAFQIHPWLDSDAPSPIFHFALAPPSFTPLRLISANPPTPERAATSASPRSTCRPPHSASCTRGSPSARRPQAARGTRRGRADVDLARGRARRASRRRTGKH
ncbi:hypothetical protein K438DRAFT_1172071 [Mycena galopus ATCC 62051]|nr:hypothetical protein K438DRAFT_1172071 [Mycena galopus ATCC 62051]